MMDIRPIKSTQDYERALARVDELMDAEPDTPEGDELDVLVTLVESYENKHFPIESPDPVEAILFRMEEMDLIRKDLEPYFFHTAPSSVASAKIIRFHIIMRVDHTLLKNWQVNFCSYKIKIATISTLLQQRTFCPGSFAQYTWRPRLVSRFQ